MTLFSVARPVAFRKTEENGTDGTFPVYPAKKTRLRCRFFPCATTIG